VNPNPKTKHRPKHGPKHCFGTEAWIETQTMFRSIPKQCFGINYSMRHRIVKKRGHKIANTASVVCYGINYSMLLNRRITTTHAALWRAASVGWRAFIEVCDLLGIAVFECYIQARIKVGVGHRHCTTVGSSVCHLSLSTRC